MRAQPSQNQRDAVRRSGIRRGRGTTRRRFRNRGRNCREDRSAEVQGTTGMKQSDQKEDHGRHLERQEAEILKHRVVVHPVLILVEVAKPSGQDDQGEGSDHRSASPSPQEIAMFHLAPREILRTADATLTRTGSATQAAEQPSQRHDGRASGCPQTEQACCRLGL